MFTSRHRRGAAALVAALALGAAGCGSDEEIGNMGQDPQAPGVTEGQNPAVESKTNTTGTTTAPGEPGGAETGTSPPPEDGGSGE